MKKQLVYTVAFGDKGHHDLAITLFESLRKIGYTGDCILMSDCPVSIPKELDVKVILFSIPGRMPLYKGVLPDDVAKKYQQIIQQDTDGLFTSLESLQAIFDAGDHGLAVARIPWKLCDDRYNLKYFTEDEREAVAKSDRKVPKLSLVTRSVNAGTFSVSGDKYAEVMKVWRKGWTDIVGAVGKENPRGDQPLLQVLIYRELIQTFYIPDGLVGFPAAFPTDVKENVGVLHFVGSGTPQEDLVRMKKAASDTPVYLQSLKRPVFRTTAQRIMDRMQAAKPSVESVPAVTTPTKGKK